MGEIHAPKRLPTAIRIYRRPTIGGARPPPYATIPKCGLWGVAAYGRITTLLDLASESDTRWVIKLDAETLRSELGFNTEPALAAFMAKLVNKELFYALEDDCFLPAPLLCPHEPEFPAPPTLEESVTNLATHTYDSPEARLALRDAQTEKERAAVKNQWPQYEAALRAAGIALPDPSDAAAYKAAKAAFVYPFLDLYDKGKGMKPQAALETMLNRFEMEQQLRDKIAESEPEVVGLSRSENVTNGASAPFVTTPARTALERQSEKEEDRSDSNNSLSSSSEAARVINENAEGEDLSRNPNVTNTAEAEAEQKTVVVEFLSEIGVSTPEGLVATISRSVVEAELIPKLQNAGLTLPQIHERAQRQGRWLPFRKVDKGGTWGGMWYKSILGDFSAPEGYVQHERALAEQRKRETAQQQRQAQAAQQEALEQQAARRTQQYWEASTHTRQQEIIAQAGAGLVDAWRKKWIAHQEGKGELSRLVCDALNRGIENALRQQCELSACAAGAPVPARYKEGHDGELETNAAGSV